jgi:arabinan endo-1,5-alpha-L-arabinosidase
MGVSRVEACPERSTERLRFDKRSIERSTELTPKPHTEVRAEGVKGLGPGYGQSLTDAQKSGKSVMGYWYGAKVGHRTSQRSLQEMGVNLMRWIWTIILLVFGCIGLAQDGGLGFSGDYTAHDPTLIKAGGVYYVFSTGEEIRNAGNIQIRSSRDLKKWTFVGTVFAKTPAWIEKEIGFVPNLWAPDVVFWNGKYYLYYAGSTFGSQDSVIGLATNVTLDPKDPKYRWVDEGLVLRSKKGERYNAIDPGFVLDAQKQPWLVWGSYWDGIRLRKLGKTGKLDGNDRKLYELASRGGDGVEAPTIFYQGGYYYLLVSFDRCCAGVESNYKIMVGRSREITGPYMDQNGLNMLSGGGTLLLQTEGRFIGPGGQFPYFDAGTWRLIFHYYDGDEYGNYKMGIRSLVWADGWPVVK